MTDQAGMRAIGVAVAQLSDNPYPPEAFRWSEVLRLRVGQYRIMYTVEGDLITILRVDRRAGQLFTVTADAVHGSGIGLAALQWEIPRTQS